MKISNTVVAAVAGLVLAPAMAAAAVIGGTNYASQYDYREFFSIADHHDFKVVLEGNPFPGSNMGLLRAVCCRRCRRPSPGPRSPSPTTSRR